MLSCTYISPKRLFKTSLFANKTLFIAYSFCALKTCDLLCTFYVMMIYIYI